MSRIIDKIGGFWTSRKREVVFGFIIFLIASLSFGLGYLANRELNHAPIIIQQNSSELKENP
ncbi:MAG: hypothetical protein Q7R86_03440 [bacterium]|nr:hypothetical protein [bacterium]